jgi:hypothetical protein
MNENIKLQEQRIELIVEKMRDAYGKINFKQHVRPLFAESDSEFYVATIRRMSIKGLIILEVGSGSDYNLTDYGWTFKGFENEKVEKERNERLERVQKKSVIETNRAVQRNIVTQERYAKRSIYIALASLLFIGITGWMQYRDNTEQEIKDLRLQVRKSTQSLDSIKLFIHNIDSSMARIYNVHSEIKNTFVKKR